MKKLLIAAAAALVLVAGPAFAGDDGEVEPGSPGFRQNLEDPYYRDAPCSGFSGHRWHRFHRHELKARRRHLERHFRPRPHRRMVRVFGRPVQPDR